MPDRVAERVCTVEAPCFTTTLTVAESPTELPAVPLNVGVESEIELLLVGAVMVTVGATVEIVKVFAELVVEFVALSVWVAVTV